MNRPVTTVRFYLDFISPYTWLALAQARAFAAEHEVTWDVRPVVYAKLLEASGLTGPVESPAKRVYTIRDVLRCAAAIDLVCVGPPAHPFRSVEALRCAVLFENDPRQLDLCAHLADAAWGRGLDLTDETVLAAEIRAVDLPADDLGSRLRAPEIKSRLRDLTTEAIGSGVFGVPTFALGNELFWGHDRLAQLAMRLHGDLPDVRGPARRLLERPAGARRRRS